MISPAVFHSFFWILSNLAAILSPSPLVDAIYCAFTALIDLIDLIIS